MNHNEFANASVQPTASAPINQRLDAVVEQLEELVRVPHQITLEVPIKRGEQLINDVALRKPDAGSLRGIKLVDLLQMDMGALGTLLPRITSPALTPADVGKLDPVDLISLGTEVSTFFVPRKDRASQPA